MLQIRTIDVLYGDVQVLWTVSFEVKAKEIVAMIGANGAGKSTILKTISGILRPKRGEILFEGKPIYKIDPFKLTEMGIAHVPEARRLFVEMSVEENLDMGSLRGQARVQREKTKAMVFELLPRLRERRRQLAGTLSGGEQQMLAIGRGLMSLPKLQMFDEPSLGLAPLLVREVFNTIRKINGEGTTILIVEQNVRQTLLVADRGYVLETGRITQQGTGPSLLNDEHVKTAYLGV
ncbi:MAG TPA: ABC transporter ATP-binding protein [Thermodesulfobacteriota bacterium]|nr:ABC transporter ATP-binding protein [Thermodesulfobacteriota bacterium]